MCSSPGLVKHKTKQIVVTVPLMCNAALMSKSKDWLARNHTDWLKISKSRDKQNHNSNKQDKFRETQMYKLTKNTKDRTTKAPLQNKGITMTISNGLLVS